MQWLLYGSTLTSAVAAALVRHGHQTHAADELGLSADAGPLDVVKAADQRQWDILTSEKGIPGAVIDQRYPFGRTIVYLQLEGGDVEQDDAIDRLFDRYRRLSPQRLYTVTEARVKIRQLPTMPGRVSGTSSAKGDED